METSRVRLTTAPLGAVKHDNKHTLWINEKGMSEIVPLLSREIPQRDFDHTVISLLLRKYLNGAIRPAESCGPFDADRHVHLVHVHVDAVGGVPLRIKAPPPKPASETRLTNAFKAEDENTNGETKHDALSSCGAKVLAYGRDAALAHGKGGAS